jgi:hypothetical protein
MGAVSEEAMTMEALSVREGDMEEGVRVEHDRSGVQR